MPQALLFDPFEPCFYLIDLYLIRGRPTNHIYPMPPHRYSIRVCCTLADLASLTVSTGMLPFLPAPYDHVWSSFICAHMSCIQVLFHVPFFLFLSHVTDPLLAYKCI